MHCIYYLILTSYIVYISILKQSTHEWHAGLEACTWHSTNLKHMGPWCTLLSLMRTRIRATMCCKFMPWLYFMYRSLQFIIFMLCNVVVLRHIIWYCNIGWHVKDGVVHHGCQQWLVAKWLGLGVTVRVMVRARTREWNYLFFFCFVRA